MIDGLEGIDEIDFVCHSLGNLVVRRYLGEASQAEPRWKPDPRIKRMVMLGPPNNGAPLRRAASRTTSSTPVVAGPSGKQLARTWDECQKLLATPASSSACWPAGSRQRPRPQSAGPGRRRSGRLGRRNAAAGAARFPRGALPPRRADGRRRTSANARWRSSSTAISRPRTSGSRSKLWGTPCVAFRRRAMSDALPRQGRLAAIDYGTVRIGVAITDPDQRLASPLENYTRRGPAADAAWIKQLAEAERIAGFVVGLAGPHQRRGEPKIAEARRFGQWLAEATGLPVRFFDERYTTAHAEALLLEAGLTKKRRKERLDKLAAQILLAAYLESSRTDDGVANAR